MKMDRGSSFLGTGPDQSDQDTFVLSMGFALLKPSSYWEYPAVHLKNLLIFAGAAGACPRWLPTLPSPTRC